jgi:ribosomal protein S18 acetylase RimI-like enzyme
MVRMIAQMRIRALVPNEIDLHRAVRLRALQDAPDSFGETLADVAARPITYWEELTRSVTEPERHVMFLACEGDEVLGCVYGLVNRQHSDHGRVGSMWVSPGARRRGIGQALLEAVIAWSRRRGFKGLGLWAPAHSPAALALYAKAGFRETGLRQAMPTNPNLDIVEMTLQL